MPRLLNHDDYRVGWICPLEIEQFAAMEMLDEKHETLPKLNGDTNTYTLGSINNHNVVIAGLPQPGNCPAATVVAQMRLTFPKLQYGLLVGIGGGVPIKTEHGMIRLGHVIVSKPKGIHSGVVQYDHGKARAGGFERQGLLAPPPTALLNAAREVEVQRIGAKVDPIWENVQRIQSDRLRRFRFPGAARDHLYQSDYEHRQNGASCEEAGCDQQHRIERPADEERDSFIVVHRGVVASGEVIIKDAKKRDDLAREQQVLCFETEAAGALSDFPSLVIRGISDYCDSHKNDVWHGYAAAAAAAYARQLFCYISVEQPQRPEGSKEEQRKGSASHFLVPYPSNGRFTGRSDILDQLKDQLYHRQKGLKDTAQARASLYGLSGVGKTQIALAYVYWLHKTFPDVSIFWVHASSAERFRRGFVTIGEICRIPGYDGPGTNVLHLVKTWLETRSHGQWLMVIDDADDLHLSFNHPGEGNVSTSSDRSNLRGYIPECAHGAVLCTTRNRQTGSRIANGGCLIEIRDMAEKSHQLTHEQPLLTFPSGTTSGFSYIGDSLGGPWSDECRVLEIPLTLPGQEIFTDSTHIGFAVGNIKVIAFQKPDDWIQLALYSSAELIMTEPIVRGIRNTPLRCKFYLRHLLRLFFFMENHDDDPTLMECRVTFHFPGLLAWEILTIQSSSGSLAPRSSLSTDLLDISSDNILTYTTSSNLIESLYETEGVWKPIHYPYDLTFAPGDGIYHSKRSRYESWNAFDLWSTEVVPFVRMSKLSQHTITTMEVRGQESWQDVKPGDEQATMDSRPLDWSSPLQGTAIELYEPFFIQFIQGIIVKTTGNDLYLVEGHPKRDVLNATRFICSIKPGSNINFERELGYLIYVSVEGCLTTIQFHIDDSGAITNEPPEPILQQVSSDRMCRNMSFPGTSGPNSDFSVGIRRRTEEGVRQ